MKKLLSSLGLILLAGIAGALMIRMEKPDTGKPVRSSQGATQRISQHTAQEYHEVAWEEKQLPEKETISFARREEFRRAKTTTPKESKQLQDTSAPAATPETATAAASIDVNHSLMPLAYKLKEEWVAENFPEVPPPILTSIKDEFENELGPEQQDTSSTEYASRWQSAEFMAQARMRARYGWAAYAGMQMHAVMENSR